MLFYFFTWRVVLLVLG